MIDLKPNPCDTEPVQAFVPDLVTRATELGPEHAILVKVDVYDAAFQEAYGETNGFISKAPSRGAVRALLCIARNRVPRVERESWGRVGGAPYLPGRCSDEPDKFRRAPRAVGGTRSTGRTS
jgi:hypothetical protein